MDENEKRLKNNAYWREWRRKSGESYRKYMREWSRAWRSKNRARSRELVKQGNDKLRSAILEAYGGKCVCCGETTPEFLTIDHITRVADIDPNAGGNKRMKRSTPKYLSSGTRLYRWLRDHDFPKDNYRLLCANCNFVRRGGNPCPHEVARSRASLTLVECKEVI